MLYGFFYIYNCQRRDYINNTITIILSIKICLSVFQMSTNNDLIYKPINKNILHIFYYISFTFLNNNTNQ